MLCLSRLAVHYYRPDFTEGQAKVLIADMVADLEGYSVAELEAAIASYRRNEENRFFPRSGQLISLIEADRKERRDLSKPRAIVNSRPILWWTLPRKLWRNGWRECDAPDGSLVRDEDSGQLRPAYRFS